jgi:hypothetical protein
MMRKGRKGLESTIKDDLEWGRIGRRMLTFQTLTALLRKMASP